MGPALNRWCADDRLLRRGHGVHKLARWVPTPYDAYSETVALVGAGPRAIEAATPKQVRRKLPSRVEPVTAPKGNRATSYEGTPSQRAADAIESCVGSVMTARLLEAAKQARGEGLVTASEYNRLKREPS